MKATLIFEKQVKPDVIVRVIQLAQSKDYQIAIFAPGHTKHKNAYNRDDAIKTCHEFLDLAVNFN